MPTDPRLALAALAAPFAVLLLAAGLLALGAWGGARLARRRPPPRPVAAPGPPADPLTGLPTRSWFDARAAEAASAGSPHAVVHVAVDGIRRVNAVQGRAAGDHVLADVGSRLRRALRAGDDLARLGGDEFALLLREPEGSAEGSVDVAVRLLGELVPAGAGAGGPGVSVGVAYAPARRGPLSPGEPGQPDVPAAAESALAAARAAGGGCVRVFDPVPGQARRREERTAAALRAGLDTELEVHYQPSVDLDAGAVTGVECLVRWRREGVLVGPDAFVGVAERHGIVADLGLRVLAAAVRDAPALAAAARHDLVVAVNVSAPQLRDPRLLPAVRDAVAALAPQRLVLEMTETVLVADDPATGAALDALAAAGAHLTVDDFGTGFATLAYLRRRPFTAFKVDRSYVQDVTRDARTRDLVEGMVLLAAATGLGLVVEGVETPEEARLLHALGAPTQQGFLHARPEPLPAAVATLARLRASLGAGTPER